MPVTQDQARGMAEFSTLDHKAYDNVDAWRYVGSWPKRQNLARPKRTLQEPQDRMIREIRMEIDGRQGSKIT